MVRLRGLVLLMHLVGPGDVVSPAETAQGLGWYRLATRVLVQRVCMRGHLDRGRGAVRGLASIGCLMLGLCVMLVLVLPRLRKNLAPLTSPKPRRSR